MVTNTEFDTTIEKVIPSTFYTICSSSVGEQSEESYNVGKSFPKFPNKYGRCGSAFTSAFLEQQYNKSGGDEDISMHKLCDIRKILRGARFNQTPIMSCSRPIRSKTRMQLSAASGTKRAIVIGIKYTGQASELKSSHDDASRMVDVLMEAHGFTRNNITLMLDDNGGTRGGQIEPTKRNIEDAFITMAQTSVAGDTNFIAFSGHGGQIVDKSGDEESGFDSSIIPVDAMTNGQILDDDILEMLVKPMKAGVTTVALVDGCYSSNIFDLPYSISCSSDDNKQNRKKNFDMTSVTEAKRPLTAREKHAIEKAKKKAAKEEAKRARKLAEAEAAKSAAAMPPQVMTDAQGRTMVMGNPSPEQMAAIQQQMMANMSLQPGQTVSFQVGTPSSTVPRNMTQRVSRVVGHKY